MTPVGAFGVAGAELIGEGVGELLVLGVGELLLLGVGELLPLGVGELLLLGVGVSLDDAEALGVGDALVETEAPGVGDVLVETEAPGVCAEIGTLGEAEMFDDSDGLAVTLEPVVVPALWLEVPAKAAGTQSSVGVSLRLPTGDSSIGGEDDTDAVTVGAVDADDTDTVAVGSAEGHCEAALKTVDSPSP